MTFTSRSLPICICLLLASFAAVGQYDKQINAYATFGGMRFEMDTLTLTHRQVSDLLSINPLASQEFKLARRSNTASGIMGFTGALLLAIPVFSAILGGEPEWLLAAGGGALVIASIPLNRSYKRRASSAIDTYNAALPVKARLYLAPAAIGIRF